MDDLDVDDLDGDDVDMYPLPLVWEVVQDHAPPDREWKIMSQHESWFRSFCSNGLPQMSQWWRADSLVLSSVFIWLPLAPNTEIDIAKYSSLHMPRSATEISQPCLHSHYESLGWLMGYNHTA